MAVYRDDDLQTLGDILPRMKPLPNPPRGASDDEQARTQQHNDALAKLQSNARVARTLAENAVNRGGDFPDSLLHFVPGRLVAPLATVRAGKGDNRWAGLSSADSPNETADPWGSYANSAVANAQDGNSAIAPSGGNAPSLSRVSSPPASTSGNIAQLPIGPPPAAMGAATKVGFPPVLIPVPPAAMGAATKVGFPPVLIPVPPGADIIANMNAARAHSSDNAVSKYLWFYNQVHDGGPWDYKRGGNPQYEPFGNFNYGATGHMLGVSPETLQRMAGLAQIWKGTSKPTFGTNPGRVQSLLGIGGTAPYGDDPRDQMFIDRGFRYTQPPHGASGTW